MRRKYYTQPKHSGLMIHYGKYYYYLFLEDFFFEMFVIGSRFRPKAIINFNTFTNFKKILKINFNNIYKHLCLSNNKKIPLEPTFLYGGQFFARRSYFMSILKNYDINGAVLHKNNVKNKIGNNFFLTDFKSSILDSDFFKNEDYKIFFTLKGDINFLFSQNCFDIDKNIFYQINLVNIIEIYKIIILLNITHN